MLFHIFSQLSQYLVILQLKSLHLLSRLISALETASVLLTANSICGFKQDKSVLSEHTPELSNVLRWSQLCCGGFFSLLLLTDHLISFPFSLLLSNTACFMLTSHYIKDIKTCCCCWPLSLPELCFLNMCSSPFEESLDSSTLFLLAMFKSISCPSPNSSGLNTASVALPLCFPLAAWNRTAWPDGTYCSVFPPLWLQSRSTAIDFWASLANTACCKQTRCETWVHLLWDSPGLGEVQH